MSHERTRPPHRRAAWRRRAYSKILLDIFLLRSAVIGGLAFAIGSGSPATAQPDISIAFLSRIDIAAIEIDGQRAVELSGLAWDRDAGQLFAISDKGVLFHLQVRLDADDSLSILPTAAYRLTDEGGAPLDKRAFNAEAIATIGAHDGVPDNTELLIASESGPQIARFSTNGRRIETLSVEQALWPIDLQDAPNDGLEALTVQAPRTIVTAPERPLSDTPADLHRLYSSAGHRHLIAKAFDGKTRIKAMETLDDGRLMILERRRLGEEDRFETALRIVDLGSCATETVCPTISGILPQAVVGDMAFEGLTQIAPDLVLLVTDDRSDGERRTLFALLRFAVR